MSKRFTMRVALSALAAVSVPAATVTTVGAANSAGAGSTSASEVCEMTVVIGHVPGRLEPVLMLRCVDPVGVGDLISYAEVRRSSPVTGAGPSVCPSITEPQAATEAAAGAETTGTVAIGSEPVEGPFVQIAESDEYGPILVDSACHKARP